MRISILIILSISLLSCTTLAVNKTEKQVVHVVLIWLKAPGNEQHIERIINTTHQLKEIEEIKQLRIGKSISSNRKIVDDSFDIGLYMIFDSNEAMQNYLIHPIHKHAVRTIIKPLAVKIRVHDFNAVIKQ